jgi:IS30 family transposase
VGRGDLVTNVSSATIKKFFWQNIICLYGVPHHITVDNMKYFNNVMFKDFRQQIRMKVAFALVYHPQSNGAVEMANALIFEAIKKILKGEKKEKWAEVMRRVVWSHNTIVSRVTNFTPLQPMYRFEEVLP